MRAVASVPTTRRLTVDSVLFTAVIYLTDVVGLDITQVGIFFLVALLGTIPGA